MTEIKTPIIEFKSREQLDACLAEWQSILMLHDWIITASIVPREKMSNKDGCAEAETCFDLKAAKIRIIDADTYNAEKPDGSFLKKCDELTLVHEMIHISSFYADTFARLYLNDKDKAYFGSMLHSFVEQTAKSLIMAKYGIGFDWFKNF